MTESTSTAIVERPNEPELTPFEAIERVITSGDLGKMKPEERVAYYWRVCESLGLNPLTRPFEYITLDGKMTLYVRKDATDQLRRVNGVSVTSMRAVTDEASGMLTVWAHGRDRSGREDEASGVVFIRGLGGNTLANAMMKAETKAKRRLTLSLVGLGFLDESEVESTNAAVEVVDPATGEITGRKAEPVSLLEAVRAQAEVMAPKAEFVNVAEAVLEHAVKTAMTEGPTGPIGPGALRTADIPTVPASSLGVHVQTEPPLMAEPMPENVSASIAPDEIDGDYAEVMEAVQETKAAGAGLTVDALAALAREKGKGKLAFATALEVVPSDIGKRIEAMTDAERHDLAVKMGMLP